MPMFCQLVLVTEKHKMFSGFNTGNAQLDSDITGADFKQGLSRSLPDLKLYPMQWDDRWYL